MMKWIKCGVSPFFTMVMQKIGSLRFYSNPNLVLFLTTLIFCNLAYASPWGSHTKHLELRARLAYVEGQEIGRAASLRFRFGLESVWQPYLRTMLEIDHVELGWESEFSNGVRLNGQPSVPDVAGTDLNQAWLNLAASNTLNFVFGREALNWGNERFVGANGFWQNEQSFDLIGLTYLFLNASSVQYRYVDNVNRITGDDANASLRVSDLTYTENNGRRPARFLGDHNHDSHLIFIELKEWDDSQLQLYYFDIDNKNAPSVSSRTFGARYDYLLRKGDLRVLAHTEAALQKQEQVSDAANLRYLNVGGGLGYRRSQVMVKLEQLDAVRGQAFTTSLASLHDHNGWSDVFLVTPEYGLRDYSVQGIWRKAPWKIDTRYHIFNRADSSKTLGREFDMDVAYTFNKYHRVHLRLADFHSGDTKYADERRIFLQYRLHF